MFVLLAGLFGIVLLPFLVLFLPYVLWLSVPTIVLFGTLAAARAVRRHRFLLPRYS
jgi:hypothetical protein